MVFFIIAIVFILKNNKKEQQKHSILSYNENAIKLNRKTIHFLKVSCTMLTLFYNCSGGGGGGGGEFLSLQWMGVCMSVCVLEWVRYKTSREKSWNGDQHIEEKQTMTDKY